MLHRGILLFLSLVLSSPILEPNLKSMHRDANAIG